MASLLDVVYSMFLGITIILIILNANGIVREGWFTYNAETMVQQMLISTATLVEGEFRNMGFGVEKEQATSSGIILFADSSNIRFTGDVNRDSTINEIEYRLGETSDVSFQNEKIRPLYRSVDNGTEHIIGMVTEFTLRYYNREGEELPVPLINPGNIHLIEIEMEVQHPHALHRDHRDMAPGDPDAFYATSRWRQTRLSSKNFQTR